MQIKLRVLGPIEVMDGDRAISLAGQKQRALLAALALDLGNAVPVSRLVDVLWDNNPPRTARNKVQDHISTLRRAMGQGGQQPDGLLLTRPPGYLLNRQRVALDLTEFTTLTVQARSASESGQWAAASGLLATALGLWRGSAFADVSSPRIAPAATALEERRLLAVEAKAEADLAGRGFEIVASELAAWLAAHPLRERLRALMMMALCGLGCRAEALALYREGRQVMVEELGIEPGVQLSGLHERILAGDPMLQSGPGTGWYPVGHRAAPVPPARIDVLAGYPGLDGRRGRAMGRSHGSGLGGDREAQAR